MTDVMIEKVFTWWT